MVRPRPNDAEFVEFVSARSTELYRSAYMLATSKPAAEDLLQSTLAKVYVAWPKVSSADDPVAYAHGMLIKCFLSDRRRRSSKELPVAETDYLDHAVSPHDPTDRIALVAALRKLSPIDRAVVVLRYWDDQSISETSRRLHLSEAAVKNRSLRALRTLRELLADPLSGDPPRRVDDPHPTSTSFATTHRSSR